MRARQNINGDFTVSGPEMTIDGGLTVSGTASESPSYGFAHDRPVAALDLRERITIKSPVVRWHCDLAAIGRPADRCCAGCKILGRCRPQQRHALARRASRLASRDRGSSLTALHRAWRERSATARVPSPSSVVPRRLFVVAVYAVRTVATLPSGAASKTLRGRSQRTATAETSPRPSSSRAPRLLGPSTRALSSPRSRARATSTRLTSRHSTRVACSSSTTCAHLH
jgi:hypothetical protein